MVLVEREWIKKEDIRLFISRLNNYCKSTMEVDPNTDHMSPYTFWMTFHLFLLRNGHVASYSASGFQWVE